MTSDLQRFARQIGELLRRVRARWRAAASRCRRSSRDRSRCPACCAVALFCALDGRGAPWRWRLLGGGRARCSWPARSVWGLWPLRRAARGRAGRAVHRGARRRRSTIGWSAPSTSRQSRRPAPGLAEPMVADAARRAADVDIDTSCRPSAAARRIPGGRGAAGARSRCCSSAAIRRGSRSTRVADAFPVARRRSR